jgi:hypothetical protein
VLCKHEVVGSIPSGSTIPVRLTGRVVSWFQVHVRETLDPPFWAVDVDIVKKGYIGDWAHARGCRPVCFNRQAVLAADLVVLIGFNATGLIPVYLDENWSF